MEKLLTEKQLQGSHQGKSYIKPQINRIQLVASEAVLALCKLGTGGSSGRNACTPDLNCISTARS